MPARKRARRGEGDQLATEIVDRADELLRTVGNPDAISINDIVRAVGCTPPALYLHYESKQAVFLAVCERHFAGFRTTLDAEADKAASPLDALIARGRAYLDWGLAHPEAYRIIFMHRRDDDPGGAVGEQSAGALDDQIAAVQRCIDDGHFDGGDSVAIGLALWASVHGLTSLLITKPSIPWPDLDRMAELMIFAHGLGINTLGGLTAALSEQAQA